MFLVVFCKNVPYLCKFEVWLEICINQRAVLFRREGDSVLLGVLLGVAPRRGVDGEVRAILNYVTSLLNNNDFWFAFLSVFFCCFLCWCILFYIKGKGCI